jgi:hypothetical protein
MWVYIHLSTFRGFSWTLIRRYADCGWVFAHYLCNPAQPVDDT